jgi:hypothetical protein
LPPEVIIIQEKREDCFQGASKAKENRGQIGYRVNKEKDRIKGNKDSEQLTKVGMG